MADNGYTIGGAVSSAAVNSTFGILSSYLNNKWAAQREAEARRENFEYNEQAADAADTRTRNLYADLYSPQAQMQQIKAAGLSPSIFYGDTAGISGQTGAQGAGPSGISPNVFGISPIDFAQIKLIQAQTEKTQAETENVEKDTELKGEEINNIIARTNNTELKNEWQALQNEWQQYENAIKGDTGNKVIKQVEAQTKKIIAELQSAEAKAEIDQTSKENVIEYIKQQTLEMTSRVFVNDSQKALNKANINLSDSQAAKLLNDIAVSNRNVAATEKNVEINENKLKAQVAQWAIENGFTEKGQYIELTKALLSFFNGANGNAIKLIDSLIPFTKK